MPGASSGLARDVNLVRRRAWLFLPFLVFGIIVALLISRVIGESNAVATLTLDTVIQDVASGGDRGLRIYEAQSMTSDQEFRDRVLEAIGDPDFDYSRFTISLAPISIADGISRGILTISIQDSDKAEAERLRQAFVDVFVREFTELDGLFRQRFIDAKADVAAIFEEEYSAAYTALLPQAQDLAVPLDEAVRGAAPLRDALSDQEAALVRDLGAVQAALAGAGADSPAIAASLLGIETTDDPRGDLEAYEGVLTEALGTVRERRLEITDGVWPQQFQSDVDSLRSLYNGKFDAQSRLQNARIAVTSAISRVDIAYAFSGGVAGTLVGRVAVALVVTVVGGLIAIYVVEWLSQAAPGTRPRKGSQNASS